MDNIISIKLLFSNNDEIILNKNEFNDFYIANLDETGEETPYENTMINNKLYANFFLLKLKKDYNILSKINRIKQKYDITEIQIFLNNNKMLIFDVPSNADPFIEYNNEYEYTYEDNENFGLLLSQYNIKFKDNLFI